MHVHDGIKAGGKGPLNGHVGAKHRLYLDIESSVGAEVSRSGVGYIFGIFKSQHINSHFHLLARLEQSIIIGTPMAAAGYIILL